MSIKASSSWVTCERRSWEYSEGFCRIELAFKPFVDASMINLIFLFSILQVFQDVLGPKGRRQGWENPDWNFEEIRSSRDRQLLQVRPEVYHDVRTLIQHLSSFSSLSLGTRLMAAKRAAANQWRKIWYSPILTRLSGCLNGCWSAEAVSMERAKFSGQI